MPIFGRGNTFHWSFQLRKSTKVTLIVSLVVVVPIGLVAALVANFIRNGKQMEIQVSQTKLSLDGKWTAVAQREIYCPHGFVVGVIWAGAIKRAGTEGSFRRSGYEQGC